MTERLTFYIYVLLLLICSSVAAKPIHKRQKPLLCTLLPRRRELRTHLPDLRMFCLAQCLRLLRSLLKR
jgi:hypothetical protein